MEAVQSTLPFEVVETITRGGTTFEGKGWGGGLPRTRTTVAMHRSAVAGAGCPL